MPHPIKSIFSSILSLALIIGLFNSQVNIAYASETPQKEDLVTFSIQTNNFNLKDESGKKILKPETKRGKNVITLDSSMNNMTADLPVGTLIFLSFPEGVESVSIKPNKGVIENAQGKYHLPYGVTKILKVVGNGSAILEVVKSKEKKERNIINGTFTSGNWAGYARTTNAPYSNITSVWKVPSATACGFGDTYSSAWVGIDGFPAGNNDLIQIGTESSCLSGSPAYEAWWEILPAASTTITGTVVAGDTIYAEINKSTSWNLTLKNLTRNWTFTTNQVYTGNQASAEWIIEAPQVNGSLATLTNYNSITFLNSTLNSTNPAHNYNTQSIDMVSTGATISAVSLPNMNTNGFLAAYGSSQPASPIGGWTSINSSVYSRAFRADTLLPSGKVLITGGEINNSRASQSELYNPSAGTWVSTGSFANARAYHTQHLVNISGGGTRVLAVGGFGTSSSLKSTELYNESTGTWSTAASMSTNRLLHSSVLLNDGKVLAIGGDPLGNNSVTKNVDLYDPLANTWTLVASLSAGRKTHTSTLLNDGRVFVAGGSTATGTTLASTEIYTPSTNTWTSGPTMNYSRADHTATLLPNGKVLIAGGADSTGTAATKAEVFDPTTNTVSNAASMNYGHHAHNATLLTLSNGLTQQVVITGGLNNSINYSYTELYDYVNDTWNVTANMQKGRANHTSTLLNDGNVLVSGGSVYPSGQTNLAEYYTAP